MKAVAWIALAGTLLAIGWFMTVESVVAIAFGWISFLRRVMPRMTIDWERVVGVAFVLFAAVLVGTGGSPIAIGSELWDRRFRWTVSVL
jgi:uncharacterized membrane protein